MRYASKQALLDVTLHWLSHGVRVFRVDNPHTKTFGFWEWMIGEVRRRDPGVIFLSEAFTRPKVMKYLAKAGFTQSYTYFAWRNERTELEEYLEELTQTEVVEFFRPNFWPNTPDILTEFLQTGGRPAFLIRAILAATLAASYGIYGPAFELIEHEPREPGSEEYRNSEKYEIRHRDREAAHSLRPLLTRLNEIRRAHVALQANDALAWVADIVARAPDGRLVTTKLLSENPESYEDAAIAGKQRVFDRVVAGAGT